MGYDRKHGHFNEEEADLEKAILRWRAAWLEHWPAHCRTCEGAGGEYDPERDYVHPCHCIEAKTCPRCGIVSDPAAVRPRWKCGVCGWRYAQSSCAGDITDAECP